MASVNAFTVTPHNGQAILTLAEGNPDGTDGNVEVLFEAALTHSKVSRIIIKPRQTWTGVVRIYLNNGSDSNVEANNSWIYEKLIDVTYNADEEVGTYEIECENLYLKGHASTPETLLVAISADANGANGGIVVTAFGSDF